MGKLKKLMIPAVFLLIFSIPLFYQDKMMLEIQAKFLLKIFIIARYIIGSCLWITAGWFVIRLLDNVIWPMLIEDRIGRQIPKLLKDFIGALIIISAVAGIVATVFEKSLSGLVAASGVAGLVVGFAVKEVISDFFSGIILSLSPPYHIGDWIKLENDEWAKVMGVNWRATTFEDFYCNTIIMPNSKMSTMAIRNFERPKKHCAQTLEFCLDFKLSTDRVINILKSAAKEGQYALGIKDDKLEPIVSITNVNEMGVTYFIYYFIPDVNIWMSARATVYGKIVHHLYQAGIRPVYPRQEIFMQRMATSTSLRNRNKQELLARTELFQAMEPSEIDIIAEEMHEQIYEPGDTIVRQGEEGNSMYFIVEGLVNVFIDFKGDSQQKQVAQVGPGNVFGEMSLLIGEPRTATVTADITTVVYELSKRKLESVFKMRPELVEIISQIVAERKVKIQEASKTLNTEQLEEKTKSFATQLLKKMKRFFGILGKRP
tara:strand:- start:294 stop:1754 length:1461 start_codon:yes stop_codon:yes gene_type:complete